MEQVHKSRGRPLTADEIAKYTAIREAIARERPEIAARHRQRVAENFELRRLLQELKAIREAKGMPLASLGALSSEDQIVIGGIETGREASPSLGTLARYAKAVGKRIEMTLVDA